MRAGSLFDIERISDWIEAANRWELGDSEPVARFVQKWGVESAEERAAISRMLLTRPDPRKAPKPSTVRMLNELDTLLRSKEWHDTVGRDSLHQWISRLRAKLLARGWTESQIAAHPRIKAYAAFRPPTQQQAFEVIAQRHGLDADSVGKAYKRREAKKAPPVG